MDYAAIGEAVASTSSQGGRKISPDRVLQYDADFSCYEVADLDRPAAADFDSLLDVLRMKRNMVGAGHVNAFITLGYKSGREGMATVKEYQENRDPDAPIKVRVRELRHMLANYRGDVNVTVIVGHFHEADDLMCREQERCIKEGIDSVLMSGDKDLWMVQGKHACPKTGRMWEVKGYGKAEYREVGNVKPKLVGEGTSWFWHQMVMGDKADNIPGLEKIANRTLDKYLPLKGKKPRKAGAASCGEAKAVAMLKGVTSDKEAARRVGDAYKAYYGAQARERFFEQAYLLWMQRTENKLDVVDFLQSAGLNIQPTPQQMAVIEEFNGLSNSRQ